MNAPDEKLLFVGCRVRILYVVNQIFHHLPGSTGTIIDRAPPAYPFNASDKGDWLVSCDLYGGPQCPFFTYVQGGWSPLSFQIVKHYPLFCPKSAQLVRINDWDPSSEEIPLEELELVQ